MHGQDALARQQVVHHGEDRLLHLSRVLGAHDEGDAPRDTDLASLRVRPHDAARRHSDDLQAPAASEQRRLGLQDLAREFDLPLDLRSAVIDVERRAGDRNPVIVVKSADWQVRARIGRIADVHDGLG